jgi:regulatory protein
MCLQLKWLNLQMPNDRDILRSLALRVLSIREHSALELGKKLKRKLDKPLVIKAVVAELKLSGVLSDARFADSYVRARITRGYGPLFIEAGLRHHGIDKSLINKALSENSESWSTHITIVWHKRFAGEIPTDLRTRLQQTRFLQYRGFALADIERLFEEIVRVEGAAVS